MDEHSIAQFRKDLETDKRWLDTPLGKAMHKYEQATIQYWRKDSDETVSNKRLRELDDAWKAAKKEFKELLWKTVNFNAAG